MVVVIDNEKQLSQPTCQGVTVILRSVGERTEAACYNLLAQQVQPENIVTLQERPFTAALAKSYQVGIEHALPWTLCIDADVLTRNGIVAELLQIAQAVNDNVFEIQGQVLDKSASGPRPAGNHLYRTSLLAKALQNLPSEETPIRPETHLIRKMASLGYPWIQDDIVVGMHDYEQYYRDIYRKAIVHARKSPAAMSHLEPLWRRLAEKDPDYRVALWGLRAGKIFDGAITIDAQMFPAELDTLLHLQGLQEKEPLPASALSSQQVDYYIDTFEPPLEYWSYKRLITALETNSHKAWLDNILEKTGWAKIVPWFVGRSLQRVGNSIQKWANN